MKKIKFVSVGFLVLLFLAVGGRALRAETATLVPVADTSIAYGLLDNNGTSGDMVIGTQGAFGGSATNRGLLRFDVAGQIPAAATITSVQLTLTVSRAPSETNSTFALHRMLREWSETNATWVVRLGPAVPWSALGGAVGVDFSGTVSALKFIDTTGVFTFDSTPALMADVTAWLKGSAPNHGWMVRTTDESLQHSARRVYTRETLLFPPQLIVQYTLPPPPRITSVAVVQDQLCLTFQAKAGRRYAVDRRPDLETGQWNTWRTIPPAEVSMEVIVCDPLGVENQFYRVVEF